MVGDIVSLARAQAGAAIRRALLPAALGLAAGVFVLFALGAAFAALFFWLEPTHGGGGAALIVAAVALALAILSLLPLAFTRRPPPRSRPDETLPQIASLVARAAPGLQPKQLLTAAAIITALVLVASRRPKK